MDIINNNPYRLLGVYANSPTRERVANEGKLKAFLKVGRQVAFPLDLPQFLPALNRTVETVAEAKAKLTLPADQIKYAQFWFVKVTYIDEVAFNNLLAGDMDKAMGIWSKTVNASSLQNRIVCALVRNEFGTACRLAQQLYTHSGYAAQLVNEVSSESNVPQSLAFDFLDMLCDEAGTSVILSAITNDGWRKHISEKTVAPIISRIQAAINTAKTARSKGSVESYNAGVKLMNGTKADLAQLKALIPTTDLQYQMIADKLGLEILQCGINYFNDSNEPDAAYKAMELQKYAQSIVVGQMAKDRCKENVDILTKIIARLPPQQVFSEDKEIKDCLIRFSKQPAKISYAISLLNSTKPHLQSIKNKLGASNSYYLKISTLVVSNALGDVIEEVNEAQNDPNIAIKLRLGRPLSYTEIRSIEAVLSSAWNATTIMDGFDMESAFKSSRYNPNRSTLQSICNNLGISTYTPPPTSPKSRHSDTPPKPRQPQTPSSNPPKDDNSCLWKCIVAIVIFILGIIVICSNKSDDNVNSTSSDNSYDATSLYSTDASSDSTSLEGYSDDAQTIDSYDSDEANEYINNRLETGSKPYKAYYGKGTTGNNYLQFNTSGDNDYVVIAKRHGSAKLMNHIYIQGGDVATIYLPDGNYDIYFYSGKGWDPTKDMGKVKGGFVEETPIEKDENVSLYNEYGQYTLFPVANGNLRLDPANKDEML